ncbi:MAG: ATP-binding protein [bacterium]
MLSKLFPWKSKKHHSAAKEDEWGLFISKRKIRFRLMVAIPLFTTLLVLALGFIVIHINSRELLDSKWIPKTQQEYINSIQTALDHTTIAIIISAAIACLTGLAIALTVTIPIRRLTTGTAEIAKGNLSRTIHVNGDGEFALLGSAFNDMISAINRYLLQSMSGGIITINEKGVIVSFSTDAEVILGIPSHEAVGKPLKYVFPYIPENKEFHRFIEAALKDRQTFAFTPVVVSTEARDAIPVSISTSLLRDREDTLVGIIISFEDIQHLKKVEEQMRKVDRLTTLGGLAAGLAHQVRNPLCSIRGLAQLLKEVRTSESSTSDYLDVILKDVDRIDRVLDRLLRFLQPTSSSWTLEDVNAIVQDALLLGKPEIRDKEIEIIEEYSTDLPKIPAQGENLAHAFLNLILNSIQAIEQKGTIRIKTEFIPKGKDENPYLCVTFTDNGNGIPPDDLPRIFDPSFSTKEDGSGFGLVITRQIVEAHGGYINVSSEPDRQTSFEINLPVKQKISEIPSEAASEK